MVFAHFVRETMFSFQDLVLDTEAQASRPIRRNEVLLIAWEPIITTTAQAYYKTWPHLVSMLAANVSMADLQARANEGFRTCFQLLHIQGGLRQEMMNHYEYDPIIPLQSFWRWRRVANKWVSQVHNRPFHDMMMDPPKPGLRVLLFSRSNVVYRHIVNEEQLLARVANSAYVVSAVQIIGERVPFWDLAAMMWEVSIIFGAEGGWVLNTIFCRPWTPVLQLLPQYKQSPHGVPPHSLYPALANGFELIPVQMNILFWRALNAPVCPGDWERDCHTGDYANIFVDLVQFDAAWRYTRRLVGQQSTYQPHLLYDDREDHVIP